MHFAKFLKYQIISLSIYDVKQLAYLVFNQSMKEIIGRYTTVFPTTILKNFGKKSSKMLTLCPNVGGGGRGGGGVEIAQFNLAIASGNTPELVLVLFLKIL